MEQRKAPPPGYGPGMDKVQILVPACPAHHRNSNGNVNGSHDNFPVCCRQSKLSFCVMLIYTT